MLLCFVYNLRPSDHEITCSSEIFITNKPVYKLHLVDLVRPALLTCKFQRDVRFWQGDNII